MAAPPPVPPIADADRYVAYNPTSSTSVFAVPFPVFGDGNDLRVYLNGAIQTGWVFSSASGVAVGQIALPITDGQIAIASAITSGMLEIFGEWRPRQGVLNTSPSIGRREYQQDIGQIVASLRETWTAVLSTFPLSKSSRANSYLAFDASGNPTSVGSVTPTSAPVSAAMAPVIAAATYPVALSTMGFSTWFQGLIGTTSESSFYAAIGGSSFGGSLASAASAAAALTLLGVSTFMQGVLSAASSAAALTALGLSAFGQTLVTAANAGAALTTLGLSSLAQSVVGQSTPQGWANTLGFAPVVRQTVTGGPVNSSGLPSFLPATSASLNLISQSLPTTPLFVTAAGGAGGVAANDLVGSANTNLTWSGLTASTTNYLYVTVSSNGALTTGSTTLAPVYEWSGTVSNALGQFTFLIGSMTGYMGNGSAAPQAYVVFVGEAVTGTTGVTSTVAYAYRGLFTSPLLAVPAASTQTFITHNLGVLPPAYDMELTFVAIATNAGGYPIGCEINAGPAFAGGGHGALTGVDQHQAAMSTSSSMSLSIPPYAGGAPASITDANWNVRLLAQRSF